MTELTYLRRFADPSAIEYGLASSALIGSLSLLDPARMTPGARLALRGSIAAAAGASLMISLKKSAAFAYNPAAKAGFSVGVTGLAFGLAEFGEVLDARLLRGLQRRGIRRPRLVMAAGTAALTLAAFYLDPDRHNTVDDGEVAEGPRFSDLDPAVKDLLEGMLGHSDYGSEVLKAQLAQAREEVWGDADEFTSVIEFAVDDDAPRAVPHEFAFPVRARFVTDAGVPLEARLLVEDGRLRALTLDVVQDADLVQEGTGELDSFDDGDPLAGVTAWPSRTDVSYVLESPEGVRPCG